MSNDSLKKQVPILTIFVLTFLVMMICNRGGENSIARPCILCMLKKFINYLILGSLLRLMMDSGTKRCSPLLGSVIWCGLLLKVIPFIAFCLYNTGPDVLISYSKNHSAKSSVSYKTNLISEMWEEKGRANTLVRIKWSFERNITNIDNKQGGGAPMGRTGDRVGKIPPNFLRLILSKII